MKSPLPSSFSGPLHHEHRQAIVELRYGTQEPTLKSQPLLCTSTIAKMLGLSRRGVCKVIRQWHSGKRDSNLNSTRLKLTASHAAFLTDPVVLKNWAHYSLKERAVLFHRTYPELKLSAESLRKLYLKHGIRYKVVR